MTELRRIHELSPAELDPLVDASVAEGFRFLVRLTSEWAAGVVRFDGPGELLLGAYEDGRLVAVGGVTRDPFATEPAVGRLRHLYVLPAARRRGVGARLVRALEAAAREHYRELVLRTDTEPAAAFYELLGYARLPRVGTATHRRPMAAPG